MWHYFKTSASLSKDSSQGKRNHGYRNLLKRVLNQKFRNNLKVRTAKDTLVLLGGSDYSIQGNVLKIYLLVAILLDISVRFHQFVRSHLFVEAKPKDQPDMSDRCIICNGKLGDWWHIEPDIMKNPWQYPTHYICEYPTDKNGVLI